MSLDIYITAIKEVTVFDANITHNLTKMANVAGLYQVMWHPEGIEVETTTDAIPHLEAGIAALEADPEKFKEMNPPNGWGTYDDLLKVARDYLEACREYPDSKISVWR